MSGKVLLILGAISPLLQGCAVYSFAPPHVNTAYVMEDRGNSPINCKFPLKPKGPDADHPEDPLKRVKQTFGGANHLIDNYRMTYECAQRHLANGRQHFEVPALLVAFGGATAMAFGAPTGVAIATGAAGALLANGKSYYSPREKSRIMAASVDALYCVKGEANGLKGYATSLIDKAADDKQDKDAGALASAVAAEPAGGATVAATATKQYFAMVSTALGSIQNIADQRLGSVGSYAPDALISEITTLSDKVKKQAEDRKAAEAAGKTDAEAVAEDKAEKIVATDSDAAIALATVTPVPAEVKIEGAETQILVTPDVKDLAANDPARLQAYAATVGAKLKAPDMVVTLADGATLKTQPVTREERTDIARKAEVRGAAAAVTTVLLKIDEMQPRIDLCIVRAKM